MISHHAVLHLTTTPHAKRTELKALYQSEAEILDQEFTTVGIGDVRNIIVQSYQTPGEKAYRLILITASGIAPEAQQAFLKILEEPPATTKFAFILPDVSGLLPTVLSRLLVIADITQADVTPDFRDFLRHSIPDRLLHIADIAKKKDDTSYTALLQGLTAYVLERPEPLPQSVLTVCAEALRTLRLRGSAKKMIWEELALSLPLSTT